MSERLKCPSCGIPTIEGRPDTTEDDLYCNQCADGLEGAVYDDAGAHRPAQGVLEPIPNIM